MRWAALVLLGAVVQAQPIDWDYLTPGINGLATTHDGSRLMFVTTMRRKGTEQGPYPKIFQWDRSGIHLVVEELRTDPAMTNNFELYGPTISGDGSQMAYSGKLLCLYCCSTCDGMMKSRTFLRNMWTGSTRNFVAHGVVGRNPRWLVHYSPGSMGSPEMGTWLLDTVSGIEMKIQSRAPWGRPSVAADGTVLLPRDADLALLRPDGSVQTLTTRVDAAVMDEAHSTVVFERGKQLKVLDVASGSTWPLGPQGFSNTGPLISADGGTTAYLTRYEGVAQLMMSTRDGGLTRQLTSAPEGIIEATLSGDGRVAFAATSTGRLLRVDVASAAVEELVGPSPLIKTYVGAAVPGSLNALGGSGFTVALPKVRLNTYECPVIQSSSGGVSFQLPWELPVTNSIARGYYSTLSMDFGDPMFEAAVEVHLAQSAPKLLALAYDAKNRPLVAVHEDFRSLVTAENPARAREVLHLYATGLSPVSPSVATAAVSAANPLSMATQAIHVYSDYRPMEVHYAGLAPGLIGIYQLDVRADGPGADYTIGAYESPPVIDRAAACADDQAHWKL